MLLELAVTDKIPSTSPATARAKNLMSQLFAAVRQPNDRPGLSVAPSSHSSATCLSVGSKLHSSGDGRFAGPLCDDDELENIHPLPVDSVAEIKARCGVFTHGGTSGTCSRLYYSEADASPAVMQPGVHFVRAAYCYDQMSFISGKQLDSSSAFYSGN